MSEKVPEELKRICLICGCHTNQAINIFEPRSGPNIVELIQAKFKFQPIHDDKYLCFSCNNWLINWHSLQNLNTDSGNQSGKPRSRINDSIPEEEVDDGIGINPVLQQNHNKNNSSKRKGFYFSRRARNALSWRRKLKKNRRKVQKCTFCGRVILKRLMRYTSQISWKTEVKCNTCKRILRWQAKYSKCILREEKRKMQEIMTAKFTANHEFFFKTNLVNRQRQRPLVDGKVVAMLRRLGTTLTRESDCRLVMHPTESKPKKEDRLINENEILIDFNTAITEVLPFNMEKYQVIDEPKTCGEKGIPSQIQAGEDFSIEAIYSKIPKCVTVSVISSSSGGQE